MLSLSCERDPLNLLVTRLTQGVTTDPGSLPQIRHPRHHDQSPSHQGPSPGLQHQIRDHATVSIPRTTKQRKCRSPPPLIHPRHAPHLQRRDTTPHLRHDQGAQGIQDPLPTCSAAEERRTRRTGGIERRRPSTEKQTRTRHPGCYGVEGRYINPPFSVRYEDISSPHHTKTGV